jgi:UMF1 family MFS transporter
MMVRHANPERPTEAFGLYALSGKATAFLAPALSGMVTYMTSSARLGLSPVIVLFIIALILLRWVKPNGDRAEWDGSSKA